MQVQGRFWAILGTDAFNELRLPHLPSKFGSFPATIVCGRARRETSLATGRIFWEATRSPAPFVAARKF
ncbi:MAG: hypothetical protein FD175_2297 [Beijerinckiaceae bacterium]|nr:MAG: hypothetical protein FD175_2297 [Beijerinckiaceae bacterium]